MFPNAVRSSMKTLESFSSSQWIKPKSEILRTRTQLQSRETFPLHVSRPAVLLFSRRYDLDMEVVVQQDVGRLQVKMEHWRFHAVEEIHAHRGLVNHLELLGPHQRVAGQQVVQRSVAHVLHHYPRHLVAHPVDGHNEAEFHFGYVRNLIQYSPIFKNREKDQSQMTLISLLG